MSMDVARPRHRRRGRHRLALAGAALAALAPGMVALSRARPAAPAVERAALSIDTVRRGLMMRQVRGSGSLVPEEIRWVTAATAGRVERIPFLPGVAVTADTVVVELSNPELEQVVVELEWEARAAAARLERLKLQIESDRLAQESLLATLRSQLEVVRIEADGDEELRAKGYGPALVAKRSRVRADELAARVALDERRMETLARSGRAQLMVQQAEIAKVSAQQRLRRGELGALAVRAGVAGVLQLLGDEQPLRVGQRVVAGAPLARIANQSRLKVQIRIAESEAKDVALGQSAAVDTRNGVVAARVARVDPAVRNGTVTVDLAFAAGGKLPVGARPDLAVDATVTIERLDGVLYVGRPVGVGLGGESPTRLFRLVDGGRTAVRVPVRFGRVSRDLVEVTGGLEPGDQVIVSDMSQWDAHDRVRVD